MSKPTKRINPPEKKGSPTRGPGGSAPGARANKIKGHGTMDVYRPPVVGIVGRELGNGAVGGRRAFGSGDIGSICR